MVVHTQGTLCPVKIADRLAQTLICRTVQGDKQIIDVLLDIYLLNVIKTVQDFKLFIWFFQIYVCFDLPEIISDIIPNTNA